MGAVKIRLEDTDDRLESGTRRSGEAIGLAEEENTCFEEQCEETIGGEDDHCEVMSQGRYVDHSDYDRRRRTASESLKSW